MRIFPKRITRLRTEQLWATVCGKLNRPQSVRTHKMYVDFMYSYTERLQDEQVYRRRYESRRSSKPKLH